MLERFRFPYVGVGVFQCAKERLTVLDSYCLVYDALRCVLCFRVYNLSPPPPPPKHYKNLCDIRTSVLWLRGNATNLRSMLSQVVEPCSTSTQTPLKRKRSSTRGMVSPTAGLAEKLELEKAMSSPALQRLCLRSSQHGF